MTDPIKTHRVELIRQDMVSPQGRLIWQTALDDSVRAEHTGPFTLTIDTDNAENRMNMSDIRNIAGAMTVIQGLHRALTWIDDAYQYIVQCKQYATVLTGGFFADTAVTINDADIDDFRKLLTALAKINMSSEYGHMGFDPGDPTGDKTAYIIRDDADKYYVQQIVDDPHAPVSVDIETFPNQTVVYVTTGSRDILPVTNDERRYIVIDDDPLNRRGRSSKYMLDDAAFMIKPDKAKRVYGPARRRGKGKQLRDWERK